MEWYEEWIKNRYETYNQKHADFYAEPSIEYIDPFRIADDLYYVGDKLVCIHLIRTEEGLILLDAGYPCAKHLLMESILRLGFAPKDVKWIILTHAHSDHFGAANEFRNLYGTKVALSAADAQSIREYPFRASGISARPPVIDKELEDGEIFSFGGKKIRCVLSPGHTLGVMSFFFNVTDQGKTYLAGLYGGAGVAALRLQYALHYKLPLDMAERMVASLNRIEHEPVKQLKEGGNPFIDPESWPSFVEDIRQKSLKIAEENAELKKKYGIGE